MIDRKEYLNRLQMHRDIHIIKVITGVRRCGKSTLLQQFRYHLLSTGVASSHIIDINFEDIRHESIAEYHELHRYILSQITDHSTYYVFLDEIQIVPEFEKAINSLFLIDNIDLYLTGSNAYMLSGELSTLLSGRYVEIPILPFSFREFLQTDRSNKDIEAKFYEYLRYGSFPQIAVFNQNEDAIRDYLGGVYNTILIKDIVSRKKITDVSLLERIIKFLMNNIGNPCSSKKIADSLTSSGRNTTAKTVDQYIEALLESFVFFESFRYDIKGKEHLKTLGKYYCVDVGLRQFLLGFRGDNADIGHILENIVYLELKRRGYSVSTGKLADKEVDFIATNQQEILYIQVAETTKSNDTLERELGSLRKIDDNYRKILLTMDKDLFTDYDGILKINLLDFLLQ